MSKNYCLHWNMPPVGFGKRSDDGLSCRNPNCRNIHEEVPEHDKPAAMELKGFLETRPRRAREQSTQGRRWNSTDGKDNKDGKGGAKGDNGKNGKGAQPVIVPDGVDPMTIRDAWKPYVGV